MNIVDLALHIRGHVAVTLALTTAAAETPALEEGVYDIWATAECFICTGTTGLGVTTANGYLVRANSTVPIVVKQGDKIGGIVASSTATLTYHRTR